MIISGISEIFLIGSVIPFITLINNPNEISKIPFLKNYINFENSEDYLEILKPVLLIFIVAIIFATIVKLINVWLIERLGAKIGSDLSSQFFRKTLYKSYLSHLSQNTSKIINSLTIEMRNTISSCKLFFRMCTSFVVGTIIYCTLIALNNFIALSILLSLLTSYF